MTVNLLGTVCSVNAYDQGTEKLYKKIYNRLLEIDSLFNVNIVDSDLSKINSAAGKDFVKVHDEVYFVLQTALDYAEKTDGLFDPTIGPLVKLWGINTDHEKVPAADEINEILPLINYKKVETDDSQKKVFLKEKGMAIDLGGIAKGYAADEVVRILSEEKIRRAVVDLGGNIFVWGKKPDGTDWKVGVKNPLDQDGTPALILSLTEKTTVVTSGVYERNFIRDGRFYHHILNPKTGYPADYPYLSSTIISSSSMDADALSTTAFILGPEKFFSTFDSKAIFISGNQEVVASKGLEGKVAGTEGFEQIKYW